MSFELTNDNCNYIVERYNTNPENLYLVRLSKGSASAQIRKLNKLFYDTDDTISTFGIENDNILHTVSNHILNQYEFERSYSFRKTNNYIKLTEKHLERLLVINNRNFRNVYVSKQSHKYIQIGIMKSTLDRDTSILLHSMNINGKLSNNVYLYVQASSIVDFNMLELYGVNLKNCRITI